MKEIIITALLAASLVIALPMTARALESTCNLPAAIKPGQMESANAKNLDAELKNPLWVSSKDHFEVCGGETTLLITPQAVDATWKSEPAGFKLTIPDNGQKYLVHKLIVRIDQESTSKMPEPVLKIEMGGNNATLILEDIEFKGAVKGIQISGEGLVSLKNISIDGVKTGECLVINTANTSIDALTAKNCSTGVLVGAKDVTISNSEITDNTVGIQVAKGILKTRVLTSKVYGNGSGSADGIVFADGPSNEIVFFDGDEKEWAPVDLESEVIAYDDRPVLMNIALNGASNSEEEVTLEFFLSEKGQAKEPIPCVVDGASNQKGSISIKASQLAKDRLKCQIPEIYRSKNLVSVLTDPRYGTTGFSQQFLCKICDVVAFVEAPFDMTTTGGGMDGAGTSSGGYEATGSDVGGGVLGNAAPKGCGAQLVPTGPARTADVALTFWWILFAGAVLGGLRTAAVRVRRK